MSLFPKKWSIPLMQEVNRVRQATKFLVSRRLGS